MNQENRVATLAPVGEASLTEGDLYEGGATSSCGCQRPATPSSPRISPLPSTIPPGVVIEQVRLRASSIRLMAGEKLEAIAEPPIPVRAEDRGRFDYAPAPLIELAPPGEPVCMPYIRIEKDPARFQRCMQVAERVGRLENSKKLHQIFRPQMEREDQEVFYVALADTQLMLRGLAEISRGMRDSVPTPVPDVARYALAFALFYGAQGVAIAHNHPSGKIQPSDADKDVTKVMKRACDALHLLFLDHLVIGMDSYWSFRDHKLV